MMMPSTMILTICISMVLKRNRGLSLDIGSRLAGSGLGGVEADPPDKNFQSPVGGLNPLNPPPPDKSNPDGNILLMKNKRRKLFVVRQSERCMSTVHWMHQRLAAGLRPDPLGSLQRSPRSHSWILRGLLLRKGEEGLAMVPPTTDSFRRLYDIYCYCTMASVLDSNLPKYQVLVYREEWALSFFNALCKVVWFIKFSSLPTSLTITIVDYYLDTDHQPEVVLC